MEVSSPAQRIAILVPVYSDCQAVSLLIPALDTAMRGKAIEADVLVMDEGSNVLPQNGWTPVPFDSVRSVSVLHLRRNLGRQRAIRGRVHLQVVLALATIPQ